MSENDLDQRLDDILKEFAENSSREPSPTALRPAAQPRPASGNTAAPETRPEPATPPTPRTRREEPTADAAAQPPEKREEPAPRRRARAEMRQSEREAGKKPVVNIASTLKAVLALVAAVSMLWALVNLHPDTTKTAAAGSGTHKTKFDMAERMNVFTANAASDALSDLVYIPKVYTIPENDLVAPKPNPACFGETDDPAVIEALIERSAELLEGQEMIWNRDIVRFQGSTMRYYCDDTLLVVTWKELRDNSVLTMAEVKMADGSQLRRALAGNSYGSGVRMKATDMASAVNAVIAINGDFYDYRQLGITAYQRQLYRNNPALVDTAFFTAGGDMLFSHRGELMGEGEAQAFIERNDVVFAVAFGPILVEDGQAVQTLSYPVGEIVNQYSRAAIAQKDHLHYLLMTAGQEGNYIRRPTTNELAGYLAAWGVQRAYNLDGGQTATIAMQGTTVNRVDWDNERTMSDIIYFATAQPGEGENP